jgi:Flp pilus assembly protein TadB
MLVLAGVWGSLAAWPLVVRARRMRVTERARGLAVRPARRADRRRRRKRPVRQLPRFVAYVARAAGAPRAARRARTRADEVARQLAVAVDLIGVGVAAGYTPFLAVDLGARWSPQLVGRALDDVVRACALGQSFEDALRELAGREPGMRPLTDTLRTSARLGTPAAPALARLAADVRADLRRRADATARTVPVRLCFPLVGCILPAFALLTVVPVVLDGLHG